MQLSRKKKALRQKMKNNLSLLPKVQFKEAGLKAASNIKFSSIWGEYKNILLFMSMENEIDTLPLLEFAFMDKKEVFLPRIEGEELKKINFYKVKTRDQRAYTKGPFGINEPLSLNSLKSEDFPALIFCPGLAFDRQGNRLGRGGAYYDRFFAEIEDMGIKKNDYLALGLCLELQIVSNIPIDNWDRKVAGLCTELEIFII